MHSPARVAISVSLLALGACAAPDRAIAPPLESAQSQAAQSPVFGTWSTPVNVGPVVNTATGENRPFISHDGRSLYFTSSRPGSLANDLWVSLRDAGNAAWQAPVNLGPNVNSATDDLAAWVSTDEKVLYFSRAGACGDVDLHFSTRSNKHDPTGWAAASDLGCGINSAFKDADPFFVSDANNEDANNFSKGGTLYFLSNRPGGPGNFDIYSARRDKQGSFSAPVLENAWNSAGIEFKIVIRSDGLEAFLGSNRPGGSGGTDLWVSTRTTTSSTWSTPVNLGPSVNSAAADAPGSLSADGTTMYLQSARPGGSGLGDVWVMTRPRSN